MQKRLVICLFWLLILMGATGMANARTITLKEKIGQMLLIGFPGMALQPDDAIVQAILKREIGGVILFDYNFATKTFDRNIQSPAQVAKLTQQLQSYNQQANAGAYPLLIGVDYEGGKVNRLKENYGFPKTLSAAEIAKLPLEQAAVYATQMAETLTKAGLNLNFAPVVDVNINPDCPVIGRIERSFSSDPNIVAEYAAVFAKAFAAHGVMCSYKHFPGHGSATGDTHQGFVDVTQTWQAAELEPYKTLFANPQTCQLVMTAHVVHYGLDATGLPASLSKSITQGLLRDKLNFQGVVITDDLQMKAVADNYSVPQAVILAVNAGADILVFGNQLADPQDPAAIIDIIVTAIQKGEIAESRIDESYQRIMQLKSHIAKTSQLQQGETIK